MITSITILILVVAILLLQLQIIRLKKDLKITDKLLVEVVEQNLFKQFEKIFSKGPIVKSKGKKRGRPAKHNQN